MTLAKQEHGEPVAEIALQYSKESVDWQCEQQIMAQAFMSEKHIQTSDKQKLVADKLEHLLWQFIDLKAKFPECSPKPETWPHVLTYAPKVEQFPAAEATTDALLVGQFRVWQPFTVIPKGTKFYTHPQQPSTIVRTWVGLTDEDWDYINDCCGSLRSAIKTAEALLKEKNT